MVNIRSYVLVVLFVVLIAVEATVARADANGNGNGNKGNSNGSGDKGNNNGNDNEGNNNGNENTGNNNGNGNKGNGNGNKNGGDNNGNGKNDDFDDVEPLPTGQERVSCKAKGGCHLKTLVCPAQCPEKKPKNNKRKKGCHVDCSSKCEVTCKWRKPNCNGYGSLCYDPRFVGGDGVMFYFHGAKGGNFAIVSDNNLQINAHFIGTRPQGRTRDFTWVQALSVMFDTHNLVIAAKKVSQWNSNIDSLILSWDGEEINISNDEAAEWRANKEEREVIVERTDETNNVRVRVSGLVEMDIKVRPVGKRESMIHNYQLPDDDAFAHLETQFKFRNLSDLVEGILGKTYRPGYVSPVKIGVAMPMMGGEDKYQTPSLLSPLCNACRFQGKSAAGIATI
ncbi:uncharacterized protein LOC110614151 [Manihot esculenta]|uniref:Late embryogenesis abundant protein LEA-2 subgroup domain-containing protein n=1 Tax=Manihot esculenta TaxID=3983 RepID=A0A2C9VYV0_MANES|nr:uncharacterized protein LOC110614151 [Manihot esculenta]OAY51637.1 hypothetical protein MANES_04G022400v8 [Manihot esculenta]